jgi:hypothetical protein
MDFVGMHFLTAPGWERESEYSLWNIANYLCPISICSGFWIDVTTKLRDVVMVSSG